MRESRHKIAEDFIAMATALVNRGILCVEQLNVRGGGNGGLLICVILAKYPEKLDTLIYNTSPTGHAPLPPTVWPALPGWPSTVT